MSQHGSLGLTVMRMDRIEVLKALGEELAAGQAAGSGSQAGVGGQLVTGQVFPVRFGGRLLMTSAMVAASSR